MKSQTLLLLALLAGLASFGQQTGVLKGKILDEATQQPVGGVTISIGNASLGAITDSAGLFTIAHIPEGSYSVTLSMIGFQEKEVADIIITRNKTYYFESQLIHTIRSLAAITVKNFRNEHNPMMPVSTWSFSREEIFRTPGTQGDIFRAIGILPGVTSSGGQFSAIAVRGQGVRDNVYIVDDIPMSAISHLEGTGSFDDPNGGRFSIFAPRTIDNAVFQGGGFGAQYGRKGSSYLGLGIKEGNKETPYVSGQFDLLGVTLTYDGPSYFDKQTSVFATARYQNFYLLEKVAGLKNIGLPAYGDYMIKTTTQLSSKTKLSFIAMYNPEHYKKTVDDVKQSDVVEDVSLGNITNNKALLGLNLRTLTGRNSYWKNIVYYRSLDENGTFGTSWPVANAGGGFASKTNIPYEPDQQSIKDDQREIGYRSIFTRHFKSATWIGGAEVSNVRMHYNRDTKAADTLYSFTAMDHRPDPSQYYMIVQPQYYNSVFSNSAWNASAYLDLSFTFLDRITLNPGLRYDHTGFSNENTLSPRLSGSVRLTGKSTLNFATGIFYQDPLLDDVADQPSTHKLICERTVQYILGYRHYFSEDVKFVAESWYKQMDSLIVRPYSGESQLNNHGTGSAYGVDLNLTKRLSEKYYGQIGYSYIQSKRDDHAGQGRYNFTYSQPNIFSVLASYKPNTKWVFSSKFRYATGRPKDAYILYGNVFNDPDHLRYSQEITGQNRERLNDFISWDIRADYRVQRKKAAVTAFIDIVDLLNRYNQSDEVLQPITGKTYYDGLGIFPSFGLRFDY